ncbi:MAG TPA: histidine kinase N-terminal 7TM domain-containing protein, partial [Polyangiaceae bacterium]|nr:histidine kinase N-terminal 7TM domain-containing protein [Polyangiaceae bacterium]
MDAHLLFSVITCVGHLAFAVLIWWRRGKSPLAVPLALLFLDTFAWTFADLAHSLFQSREWHRVDRFFSSFMPVLALQVVVVFVGKARSLRRPLRWGLAASLALALSGALSIGAASSLVSGLWWKLLLSAGGVSMLASIWLLLTHRKRSADPEERQRTELILLAVAFGTLIGTTDLWFNEVRFAMPRLSNLGTLIALGLVATATMRLRLLGREVPAMLGIYAIFAGALGVIAYLAALRFLDRNTALVVLAGVTALVVGVATVREFGRATAVTRERVQRLASLGRFSDQLAHDLRNPLAALKGALQFLVVEHEKGRS